MNERMKEKEANRKNDNSKGQLRGQVLAIATGEHGIVSMYFSGPKHKSRGEAITLFELKGFEFTLYARLFIGLDGNM